MGTQSEKARQVRREASGGQALAAFEPSGSTHGDGDEGAGARASYWNARRIHSRCVVGSSSPIENSDVNVYFLWRNAAPAPCSRSTTARMRTTSTL